MVDVTADCAQGAIARQSVVVLGAPQTSCPSRGSWTACTSGALLCFMCVVAAIARAPVLGLTHENPLPSRTNWSARKIAARAKAARHQLKRSQVGESRDVLV